MQSLERETFQLNRGMRSGSGRSILISLESRTKAAHRPAGSISRRSRRRSPSVSRSWISQPTRSMSAPGYPGGQERRKEPKRPGGVHIRKGEVACWRQRKKNSGSHRPPRGYISEGRRGGPPGFFVCARFHSACARTLLGATHTFPSGKSEGEREVFRCNDWKEIGRGSKGMEQGREETAANLG